MQLLPLVISAFAVLSGAAQAREQQLGGYSSTALTTDLKSLLHTVVGADSYYASSVDDRVCYTAVKSVSSQVVAGTNYKFVIKGCDVIQALEDQNLATTSVSQYLGKCRKTVLAGCTPETIKVTVYKRDWAPITQQITSIEYTA